MSRTAQKHKITSKMRDFKKSSYFIFINPFTAIIKGSQFWPFLSGKALGEMAYLKNWKSQLIGFGSI